MLCLCVYLCGFVCCVSDLFVFCFVFDLVFWFLCVHCGCVRVVCRFC